MDAYGTLHPTNPAFFLSTQGIFIKIDHSGQAVLTNSVCRPHNAFCLQ